MGNSGCNEGNTATIVTTPATLESNPAPMILSGGTVTSPTIISGSGAIVSTLCTSVGIKEITTDNSFLISPNPFSNEINITNTANELAEIILCDITSRKLLQQTFTNSTSLNTSQLSKGIYICEIKNAKGLIKNGKLVKN